MRICQTSWHPPRGAMFALLHFWMTCDERRRALRLHPSKPGIIAEEWPQLRIRAVISSDKAEWGRQTTIRCSDGIFPFRARFQIPRECEHTLPWTRSDNKTRRKDRRTEEARAILTKANICRHNLEAEDKDIHATHSNPAIHRRCYSCRKSQRMNIF